VVEAPTAPEPFIKAQESAAASSTIMLAEIVNVAVYSLWASGVKSLLPLPTWLSTARSNLNVCSKLVFDDFVLQSVLPRLRAEAVGIANLSDSTAATLLDQSLLQTLFQDIHLRALLYALLTTESEINCDFNSLPPLRVMISESGHEIIIRLNHSTIANSKTAVLLLDHLSGDNHYAADIQRYSNISKAKPGSLFVKFEFPEAQP
jgi:hypothetical protein